MNQKVSTMLRQMRRTDIKSKTLWNSLDHRTRGKIRQLHINNEKAAYIDFLRQVTGE